MRYTPLGGGPISEAETTSKYHIYSIYIYIYVCSAVGYSLCPLLFNVPFWRKILLSIPYLLHLPFCMKFYHWSISFLPVAEVENVPANIGPPDFDCQLNFREFHTTDTTCHNGLVYG